MSTIRANAILDSAGGSTATVNGITPVDTAGVLSTFNASGSAPVYAARAWVNFNGTGTVAIRAAGNVTSITDNAAGDYTVNFTTAMPDANYAHAPSIVTAGSAGWAYGFTTISTTQYRIRSIVSTVLTDQAQISLVIFR